MPYCNDCISGKVFVTGTGISWHRLLCHPIAIGSLQSSVFIAAAYCNAVQVSDTTKMSSVLQFAHKK